VDFIARLAALVPPPRRHLTRYRGVLAPHSSLRARVTPAGRGKGGDSTEQGGTKQGARRPGWGRLKVLFAPPKIPYSISRKNGNHLVCAQGLS